MRRRTAIALVATVAIAACDAGRGAPGEAADVVESGTRKGSAGGFAARVNVVLARAGIEPLARPSPSASAAASAPAVGGGSSGGAGSGSPAVAPSPELASTPGSGSWSAAVGSGSSGGAGSGSPAVAPPSAGASSSGVAASAASSVGSSSGATSAGSSSGVVASAAASVGSSSGATSAGSSSGVAASAASSVGPSSGAASVGSSSGAASVGSSSGASSAGRGYVRPSAELAAIKLELEPNWERDVGEPGTVSLVVKVPGTDAVRVFSVSYGYEDPAAPIDCDQYKAFLESKATMKVTLNRQRGAACYVEGTVNGGTPTYRMLLTYGGKRLVCHGSLYKDLASSALGDLRDKVLTQAKKICETLAL